MSCILDGLSFWCIRAKKMLTTSLVSSGQTTVDLQCGLLLLRLLQLKSVHQPFMMHTPNEPYKHCDSPHGPKVYQPKV